MFCRGDHSWEYVNVVCTWEDASISICFADFSSPGVFPVRRLHKHSADGFCILDFKKSNSPKSDFSGIGKAIAARDFERLLREWSKVIILDRGYINSTPAATCDKAANDKNGVKTEKKSANHAFVFSDENPRLIFNRIADLLVL